jgi:O-antigen/teichoic acid export membrane protein
MKKIFEIIKQRLLNKGLLQDSSIYMVVSAITALGQVLLIPLFTKYIPSSDYGVYGSFIFLYASVAPIISYNLCSAISANYVKLSKDEFCKYTSSQVFMLLFITIIISLALLIPSLQNYAANYFSIPAKYLQFTLLTANGYILFMLATGLMTMEERPKLFGIWRISLFLLFAIIAIALIFTGNINDGTLIWARGGSFIILAIFGLFWLIKRGYLAIKISLSDIKNGFLFGSPLIPSIVAANLIPMQDVAFLTNRFSSSESGLYTIGLQFSQPLLLLINTATLALFPWYMKRLEENTRSAKTRAMKVLILFSAGLFFINLVYCLLSPILGIFLSSAEYKNAISFIPWLSTAYTLMGVALIPSYYLMHKDKTWIIGIASIFTMILNQYLNPIMVDYSGAIGVAQATAISYITLPAIYLIAVFGKKTLK